MSMYDNTPPPRRPTPADELRERFTLTCRKCGSGNIAVNIERSRPSVDSAMPGELQIGCNDCKQNDFSADI